MLLAAPAAAQTAVPVAALAPVTWRAPSQITAILKAPQSATLAAAQSGVAAQVFFSSGESVPAGSVLVRLQGADAAAAQKMLDAAKLALAAQDLARTRSLLAINGASEGGLEQAQAAVAEDAAQVKLDAASLAAQEVIAPFAGTVGVRNLDPGDAVQAGQPITTLTGPGTLHVFFAVPQTQAALLAPGQNFTFLAPLGTEQNTRATGRLLALSAQLDTATNARAAEGVLTANAPGLLSGMTGVVEIATGAPQPAFAAPSTALNDSMLGPYIYTLNDAGSAYRLAAVYVNILGAEGDDTIFSAPGLHAGEKIVALGGFKLSDGAAVTASP